MSDNQPSFLSNRPVLSEADLNIQTSQIYRVVAEANEPMTASDIAQCFSQGETAIGPILDALKILNSTGRLEVDKRGWYCPVEQPSRKGTLIRRFGNWQIGALETHFAQHNDSLDELILLQAEMSRRKTKSRNKELVEKITLRIGELRRDDPSGFTLTSSER